jgi:hypothetical protein
MKHRRPARSMRPLASAAVVVAATLLLGASGEAELDKGMRQVAEGDFEGALITLDSLARDLAARPGPSKEKVSTYVWLGAAYSGLDQEALAIAKLEQALQLDASLTLSAETFPPKLLRLFETAKQRIAEEKTLKKEAGAKPRKKGLLLVGVGGAAAAGIALAVKPSERKNTPPSARIAISPEGKGIAFVTEMRLTAEASDAEGDSLSYEWDLGDGGKAAGPVVTHIYAGLFPVTERTFDVRLTVSDGLANTSAMRSVTVGHLYGIWNLDTPTPNGIVQIEIQGGGNTLLLYAVPASGATFFGNGRIDHPRRVRLQFRDCAGSFDGEAGPDLNTMQGTYSCSPGGTGSQCRGCSGQSQSLVLRR